MRVRTIEDVSDLSCARAGLIGRQTAPVWHGRQDFSSSFCPSASLFVLFLFEMQITHSLPNGPILCAKKIIDDPPFANI